jgi:uncharacterized protein (TIGR00369 family)
MDRPDLETARRVLDAQPFSRLLGTRITAFGDGAATLELDLDDDLRQQDGIVHGGVLAYLADNAMTFAAGGLLGGIVLTSGVSVEYVAPARSGPLVARAVVEHATLRHVVCRVVVTADGATCAVGQGRVSVRDARDGSTTRVTEAVGA